jgi:hypothetical protein
VLDGYHRAGFLARATLNALVDVRSGGFSLNELIYIGLAHSDTLADARAPVIVDLYHHAELLALPLSDVCHSDTPKSVTRSG